VEAKGGIRSLWRPDPHDHQLLSRPGKATGIGCTPPARGLPGLHAHSRGIGETKDFSALIEHAKRCAPPTELETGELVGGFAHAQVLALADKVVEAVKSGAIKKFVVMAGCDGRAKSRDYYTEFAQALPKDTVILTAGCAKYKYNKLPLPHGVILFSRFRRGGEP
jgi:hydroxylamine reductase